MHVREPSAAERELVEKYLFLDEGQLFSLIPPFLADSENVLYSPDGQEEAGRRWFAAISRSLRQKICIELRMAQRMEDIDSVDAVALAIVISDAIASQVTVVPPVLVAAIIVRMGLRRFCSSVRDHDE